MRVHVYCNFHIWYHLQCTMYRLFPDGMIWSCWLRQPQWMPRSSPLSLGMCLSLRSVLSLSPRSLSLEQTTDFALVYPPSLPHSKPPRSSPPPPSLSLFLSPDSRPNIPSGYSLQSQYMWGLCGEQCQASCADTPTAMSGRPPHLHAWPGRNWGHVWSH